MFLWNYKKLALELRDNKLSERHKFYYYVASSLIYMFSTYFLSYIPHTQEIQRIFIIKVINHFILISLTIAGLFWWYKTNSRGDNKHFIERAIILSIPLSIRLWCLVFVLAFMVSFVTIFTLLSIYHYALEDITNSYIVILPLFLVMLLCIIWYIVRMNTAIAIASGKKH